MRCIAVCLADPYKPSVWFTGAFQQQNPAMMVQGTVVQGQVIGTGSAFSAWNVLGRWAGSSVVAFSLLAIPLPFWTPKFLVCKSQTNELPVKAGSKRLNTPLIPGPPPAGKMAAWVPWRWRAGCFTSQDCGITTPSWTNCFQLFKSLCLSDSVHRFVASDFLDDSWYSTLDEAYDPAVGVLANA